MKDAVRWLLAAVLLSTALQPLGESQASPAKAGSESVVLLHGLGRTSWSMVLMEWKLEAEGFRVENIGYPSTDYGIETLSSNLARELEACCSGDDRRVHFVTHSMGGILVRHYLAHNDFPQLGRVVMLSPPNHGSEIVDALRGYSLFEFGMGPAALQLGTDQESVPNQLGPVNFELGVITGNWSSDPLGEQFITGAHDGKVSVESARVEGMADFLVVSESHTFIMNDDFVIEQTLHFLRSGSFDHSKSSGP
jgi:triacylglycerol esterase/lipase EstA (alpha/beta hydrolase family)